MNYGNSKETSVRLMAVSGVFAHRRNTTARRHYKKKRIYNSFTSDIPGPKGKRDAEKQAADWAAKKDDILKINNITLGTAIDKYIESKDAVLSITTISDYKKKRKNGFKFLMDVPIRDITPEMLQEAVNQEAKRKNQKKPMETISAKTVKNEYGLITAALNTYRKDLNCSVTLPEISPAD